MKTAVLLTLIALNALPASAALNKEALIQHLRENLALDTRTEITIQDEPVPAGFSDLKKVTVLVGGAPYEVLLSPDEKRYIWGLVAELAKSPDAERVKEISLEGVHSVGSAKAPVTVVEYSDLQCSFCRKAHEMLKEKLHTVYTPSQVRWVYKHYPLTSHTWAQSAAVLTECAAQQKEDAFWKMADFYFSNQEAMTEKDVVSRGVAEAGRLGLKTDKLKACMDDPKIKEKIEAQKKEGTVVGVSSTPTLFVNGRLRRGFREFEDVKVLIDEKLKTGKK